MHMHAVTGQCLAQTCLQLAEVVLSIYQLALDVGFNLFT